jgi:hypothetical protein
MAKASGIKINQYDTNDLFIKSYISISEAARMTGTQKTCICLCIKDKLKTAGGYKWKKIDTAKMLKEELQ